MNTLSRREVGIRSTTALFCAYGIFEHPQDEALLKDLKSEALRKCDTVVKGAQTLRIAGYTA